MINKYFSCVITAANSKNSLIHAVKEGGNELTSFPFIHELHKYLLFSSHTQALLLSFTSLSSSLLSG